MTPVNRPRRGKPAAVTEVLRTMRIYDMLLEELKSRGEDDITTRAAVLTVAERIGARTEEPA